MDNNSRTSNSVKNIIINFVLYFLTYISAFVGRTFFVKLLGNEYLSISGLFSNVITLLSFTELGIGSASVYALYKPIADNDFENIRSILSYLGRIYKIIAGVTAGIGITLIPFLPHFVKMDEVSFTSDYLILVFVLYVINSCMSYLLVEKQLFLIASQKSYLVNIIQKTSQIVLVIIQILFLLITHNFIVYLMAQISINMISNFAVHMYAEKRYPVIRKQSSKTRIPPEQNRRKLTENVGAIFFYKVGAVILNGTDNLIISSFLSTLYVGIVANYTLVINSINSVIMQCLNGIGASIGNHVVTSSKKEQESVFKQLDLLSTIVYSFCTVCLIVLLNPFIKVWLGTNYMLSNSTVLWLGLVFYVTGVNQIPSLYRTSYGLFHATRFYPLIGAIVNIVLSIFLARSIGLDGIFIATVIVRLVFFTIVDGNLIYSKGFCQSPRHYYINYLYNVVILLVIYIASKNIVKFIVISGLCGFIIKASVCFVSTLIFLIVAYGWKEETWILFRRFTHYIKGKNHDSKKYY